MRLSDPVKKQARFDGFCTYVPRSPREILKTTPFPIMPTLEQLFAFVYDIDLQIMENKRMQEDLQQL